MINKRFGESSSWTPRGDRIRVVWSSLLLVVFAIVVLAVTLTPDPVDEGLQPEIRRILAALHGRGLPDWFGYRELEFSANIALFVPLAFLIAMALPLRLWWLALVTGSGLSAAIEVFQAVLLSARFATAEDVLANSLGAVVGTGLAVAVRLGVRRRDQAVWEARRSLGR